MSREPRPKRSSVGPVTNSEAAAMIARQERPAEVYGHNTATKPPVPGRSQPHPGPACATTGAQSRSGKRFRSTPELREGVPTGTPTGNQEHVT